MSAGWVGGCRGGCWLWGARNGVHKAARKPVSQGSLNLADRINIRVFQKQESLARVTRNRYTRKFEEFRINHDEEGFTVTLESAGAEYDKMRQVFQNFSKRH